MTDAVKPTTPTEAKGPVVTVKPQLPNYRQQRDAQVKAAIAQATASEKAEKAAVAPAPVETPAEPVAAPPGTPTPEPKKDDGFSKLLQDRHALRQEAEQLKPYRNVAKVIDPARMEAIARAKAAHDPVAALAALGFSYTDYAAAMSGTSVKAPPAEKEAPADDKGLPPEVAQLKAELEELKAERKAVREKESRSAVLEKVKANVDPAKFERLAEFGDHEKVMSGLEYMYQQGGGLPAETLEESIELVALHFEKAYDADQAKWEKYLTKKGWGKLTDPKTSTTVTEPETPGPVTSGKGLTNSMSAPRPVAPVAKSREDIFKKLENDPIWGELYSDGN